MEHSQEWHEEAGEAAAGEDQQVRAVQLYAKTGSMAAVARELGTTVYVIQKLARETWWQEELAAIRRTEHALLDTSLTEILGMTLSQMKDRLILGDETSDAEGNTVMRPLRAETLVKITNVVFDKRQLLRGLPTALSNESGKLSELSRKLEALGRKADEKLVNPAPIEGFEIGE